jgi:hypothetical protein
MKVDALEMKQMIDETYEPGHEMVKALNLMYDLVMEHGLYDDPRYRDASRILGECMVQFQNTSLKRGIDVCKKNSIISELSKNKLGKYLIDKVTKKLES